VVSDVFRRHHDIVELLLRVAGDFVEDYLRGEVRIESLDTGEKD
jgi:hypothetical protein